MEKQAFTSRRDFLFNKPTPECQKRELRPPKGQNLAGVNDSGVSYSKYRLNAIRNYMYIYIAWCITHPNNPKKFREIRCEKCGIYEGLELHHTKYAPKQMVTIEDIKILCNKCHRNARKSLSMLRTIFKNGKRYCIARNFKFEY